MGVVTPGNYVRGGWFCTCAERRRHERFIFMLITSLMCRIIFFLLVSALLRDCSLCWDLWNGTWHLHLTRPCYIASGQVLIWVVCWMGWGALSIGFPHSQVELNGSPRQREGGAVGDPSLQFQDEFVWGIRYIATDKLSSESWFGWWGSILGYDGSSTELPLTQMASTSPGFILVQLVLATISLFG